MVWLAPTPLRGHIWEKLTLYKNAMEFLVKPNAKDTGASTRLHFVPVGLDILETNVGGCLRPHHRRFENQEIP